MKATKAYVLYVNETYFDIAKICAKSIRKYSKLPIYIYTLNFDRKVDIENVFTVKWEYQSKNLETNLYFQADKTFYINRKNPEIYKLLIQRPLIVKHALENYADYVAYVDSDSIATPSVDNIFSYYPLKSKHPYFALGIYDFMIVDGKGHGATFHDMSPTLEHPACELFKVNQLVRQCYRQTGYFVAGKETHDFLEEWYWMCIHPVILKNVEYYAPFNEETIVNVLLWKYNITEGLPYIYVNADSDRIEEVYTKVEFNGKDKELAEWYKVPGKKEDIMFFHGQKNLEDCERMIEKIEYYNPKPELKKVLCITPHLSTGGLPQYLLKKLRTFKSDYKISVVEYSNVSPDYVVQREQVKWEWGSDFYTLGEDKWELLKIIDEIKPDVIHLEEVPEFFMDEQLAVEIYNKKDRSYFIVETTHSSYTNPSALKFLPDKFILVSKWSQEKFARELPKIPNDIWEYPVEKYFKDRKLAQKFLKLDLNKKHVLMVGLFTPGKNQGEIFEIAKQLPDVEFHFIGNQAPNFAEYWLPLMKNKPKNCTVWGERDDVHNFYQACDLFYFSSKLELNPIAVKEALSYRMPCLFRRLETYLDTYDDNPSVTYIDDDLEKTKSIILEKLNNVR